MILNKFVGYENGFFNDYLRQSNSVLRYEASRRELELIN